jgi:stage II sporulation protein P
VTNIQRAFCVVLSLIFLCVVAVLPGDFFRHGEIYRQLPLYCFLEKKALQKENGRDRETEMLLQEKNAEHLGKEVEAENRKEQETLLMAEAEEVEKKEELQKKKEIQKKEAEEAEKKSSDGKKSEKETGKENAEPEVTESGDTGQEVAEQETPASEENRSGENTAKEQETVALPHPQIDLSQAKLADFDYVMNQFFILDSNTETNAQQISAPRFLKEDLSVKKDSSVPQILIYHTHSQEAFADSREGQTEDTIVGVGDHLTELLEKTYGYQVIHITDPFDMMGGTLDRSKAYDYARASIEKVLEENPTIEVVIDLHRDGVPDDRHLVTQVNGKPTAQLLFYNGLSYTVSQGAVSYLPNPYIEENLAFSFQLEYQAAQYYPDLYRGIYLAGLRYNLHLKPRALLLEAGAQTNTVEEVRNAMEPFADILNRVLKGSDKED